MVRTKALTGDLVVGSRLAGRFYACTGVVPEKLVSDDCGMRIRVAAESGARYRIRFVGSKREGVEAGVVLQETEGSEATYEFRGDELYVRGVVLSDRLHPDPVREGEVQTAWIQPNTRCPR